MSHPEFRWGLERFEILSAGEDATDCRVTFDPGAKVPTHFHRHSDETFDVLEGELALQVDGKSITLQAGQSATVNRLVPHSVRNAANGQSVFLVRYAPAADTGKFLLLGDWLQRQGYTNNGLMLRQLYLSMAEGHEPFSEIPGFAGKLANGVMQLVFFFGSLAGWRKLHREYLSETLPNSG